MEKELTEKDLNERIKYLQTRVWNVEQNIEFLLRRFKICGKIPYALEEYDFNDICILKQGHKGLHKNSNGFTWGWIEKDVKLLKDNIQRLEEAYANYKSLAEKVSRERESLGKVENGNNT